MNSSPTAIAGDAVRTCHRAVRRCELRRMVPIAQTTIYEMERRGEFPRHFSSASHCVVWDLDDVEQWLTTRRTASLTGGVRRARSLTCAAADSDQSVPPNPKNEPADPVLEDSFGRCRLPNDRLGCERSPSPSRRPRRRFIDRPVPTAPCRHASLHAPLQRSRRMLC